VIVVGVTVVGVTVVGVTVAVRRLGSHGITRGALPLADPVGRERNVRGDLTPPRRLTVAVAGHGVVP
jgi:hypothetical protein